MAHKKPDSFFNKAKDSPVISIDFGSPAISAGPVAFRPKITCGLVLSAIFLKLMLHNIKQF
jgi:hypothetical protein